MPYKDIEKQKEYIAKWAKKRKEKERHIPKRLRSGNRGKKKIIDEFFSRPCYACGESFPQCCMDAHHLNPAEKKFSIGRSNGKGLAVLQEELEKCVPLCAHCHRKFHSGLIVI